MFTHWSSMALMFTVTGLGFFMLHNSLQAEVAELVPDLRATAFSMHAFWFYIGQALGPPAIGLLLPRFGAPPSMWICAAILAITGAAASLMIARNGRRYPI